ncbi:hypothetical protein [Microvirga puerhi]|uniref:Uncharacterized protein n=1 Tax=Microvirga puerhi TaxID=2876078 RepID=A0ABS7VIK0_9HYPH|nr:hypothetical protein [Microvirga puerhi]MBZ6074986.1 hypothetical protein [Microvirga puerhi]
MTARVFLFAGILVVPMLAGSQVMAHSLPPGVAIDAIGRAQNAATLSGSGASTMSDAERAKRMIVSSQGAPAGKPARKKHPANRSQDNG